MVATGDDLQTFMVYLRGVVYHQYSIECDLAQNAIKLVSSRRFRGL